MSPISDSSFNDLNTILSSIPTQPQEPNCRGSHKKAEKKSGLLKNLIFFLSALLHISQVPCEYAPVSILEGRHAQGNELLVCAS